MNINSRKQNYTYFDLPAKDRKKIINKAASKTNLEQYNLVKKYGKDIGQI